MILTKRVVLCALWLCSTALILLAAPSLPAETPEIPDASAASAADSSSGAVMDPSVGDVSQRTETPAASPQETATTQPPAPSSGSEPAASPTESGTYLLSRTIGGLGLVVSLIILGYVAIRRYGPKYLRRQGSQSVLKVIETLPIGEKRSVALIQVEDKRLLIGNTQQQITLLAQLPSTREAGVESPPELSPKSNAGVVTSFRRLYEVERNQPSLQQPRVIPQDLREKMRQLREAFEK